MSCHEVLAKHSDYIDGMLALDQTCLVRTHLENCSSCARYDHALRKGTDLFRRHTSPVQLDADFMNQLHARIAEEDERMAFRSISISAGASVSIAAVLALAAWLPVMMKRVNDAGSHEVTRASFAFSAPAPLPSKPFPSERPHPVIDPGFSPLILEPPTAPPSYVELTSLETR